MKETRDRGWAIFANEREQRSPAFIACSTFLLSFLARSASIERAQTCVQCTWGMEDNARAHVSEGNAFST